MNYTLMHKDIPVADLTLDEATGSIQRIDALFRGGHLPVGVSVRHGVADRAALNEWWEDRSILPAVPDWRRRWKPWELPVPSCCSPAATV